MVVFCASKNRVALPAKQPNVEGREVRGAQARENTLAVKFFQLRILSFNVRCGFFYWLFV
jgi:hypothetical protein